MTINTTTKNPPQKTNNIPKWLTDNGIFITLILFIIGFALALIWSIFPAYPSLSLKNLQEANITEILWGAFFITLIVERTLEVFISAWRDHGKLAFDRLAQLQKSVDDQQSKIDALETQINNGITDSDLLAEKKLEHKTRKVKVESLENEIEEFQKNNANVINHYQTATRNFSLYGGFFLGFLSGLAGIRILEPLVTITSAIEPQQLRAFRSLDILLTALAISGGSQLFHPLVSIITDFAAQTRNQINTPNSGQ